MCHHRTVLRHIFRFRWACPSGATTGQLQPTAQNQTRPSVKATTTPAAGRGRIIPCVAFWHRLALEALPRSVSVSLNVPVRL